MNYQPHGGALKLISFPSAILPGRLPATDGIFPLHIGFQREIHASGEARPRTMMHAHLGLGQTRLGALSRDITLNASREKSHFASSRCRFCLVLISSNCAPLLYTRYRAGIGKVSHPQIMPSPLLPQSRTMSPPPTRAGKSKTKRYLSQFRSNPSSTSTSSAYPLSGFTGPNVPRPIKRPKKILYLMGIFVLLYWFGIRHGLGQERLRTPLGFFLPGRKRTSSVRIDSHGMATLRTPTGKIRKKLEHPIYELMERAEEKWHGLLANQSSTLEQAVQQYRKRYTLDPPAGFDKWWEFVQRHNISIRDDYDQLMKDVLPHYALKPDEWKRRALALDGDDYSYTLRVDRKVGVRITGPRAASARPRHMQNLIGGFLEDLPGDFQMQITVSDHDTGSQVLGKDQRERAMELVKDGDRE